MSHLISETVNVNENIGHCSIITLQMMSKVIYFSVSYFLVKIIFIQFFSFFFRFFDFTIMENKKSTKYFFLIRGIRKISSGKLKFTHTKGGFALTIWYRVLNG